MACSACGSKGRLSFSQIVVQDGSSLPSLKYLHCKYKDQFEQLFSSVGINAGENNLRVLAIAHDTGADKKGEIKDSNGNPIYFSVEEILKRIDISRPVSNQCSI